METSAAASDAISASGSPRLSLSVTSPSWLMGDPGCMSGSGASMKSTSGYCASTSSFSTSKTHARDICAGNQSSPRLAQPLAQYHHTMRTDVAAQLQRFSVRHVVIRVPTGTFPIIPSQERLRRTSAAILSRRVLIGASPLPTPTSRARAGVSSPARSTHARGDRRFAIGVFGSNSSSADRIVHRRSARLRAYERSYRFAAIRACHVH